ncbi:MAG: type II toxin-antitoxin system PemK/MazF family toxin [Peptoanaerobacter stomatis]|uniref:type II toxin-antitoxin system PemK/MazF family toxin n=1 Tax=Peptoanaerobacter stomatis TaxID=796937 RepID=UPI003FA0834C
MTDINNDNIDFLHKEAIEATNKFIEMLKNSDDTKLNKKSKLLCYWIKDYIKFMEKEDRFDPKNLKKYQRGEIIKAHLGMKIGREEGGLHYCVVVENNNPMSSSIVTVVPLTSIKENRDISKLRDYEINLGDEIYRLMQTKISAKINSLNSAMEEMKKMSASERKLNKLISEIDEYIDIKEEIQKMKKGSIALIKQITTISKIRIYNPKINRDSLSNIKISNTLLDKIDEAIIRNFTKKC